MDEYIHVYMFTERRWSKIENGSVMRDPGGVAILTCKSFVVVWFRRKTNRTISQLIPSAVCLGIARAEQVLSRKAND